MANANDDTSSEMLAALLAAGWEAFEGEPEPGFMVAEGPNGERLRRPVMEPRKFAAMQERWARQLEEEATLSTYERRKRREAFKRAVERDRAMRSAWQVTYNAVRREAFKAIREGRASNVLLFTPSADHRYAGVQIEGGGEAAPC